MMPLVAGEVDLLHLTGLLSPISLRVAVVQKMK